MSEKGGSTHNELKSLYIIYVLLFLYKKYYYTNLHLN